MEFVGLPVDAVWHPPFPELVINAHRPIKSCTQTCTQIKTLKQKNTANTGFIAHSKKPRVVSSPGHQMIL